MTFPEKPALGSFWRAGDGRRIRITEIIDSPDTPGGWWVKADVLPPHQKRQRKVTTAGATTFATNFYTREETA